MLLFSPAERAKRSEKKRLALLRFLRDETWSLAEILGQVMDIKTRASVHKTLVQVERDGLIKRHTMPVVWGRFSLTVWGITERGLACSWDDEEAYEVRPCFEPSRLALSRIQHQTGLQHIRLAAEKTGWKEWVRGERLGLGSKISIRPDAIAVSPDGLRIAIELEFTIKTRSRYQVIMRNHLQQIRQGNWDAVFYMGPNKHKERLKRIFSSIYYVPFFGEKLILKILKQFMLWGWLSH